MKACPCCSGQLLRHARHSNIYWFCPHCWQEMPDLSSIATKRKGRVQRLERLIRNNSLTSAIDGFNSIKATSPPSKEKVGLRV
ncbi:MAG: hypothetical protein F6J93_23150 [Oscillatoria sp. SIO1A7]|nr:hypothetical protein [Oscillatoria sp. SIO1A7]